MEFAHIILVVAAYLTSVLSGAIGMGGGMLLLAVMAEFFPPLVLIPLHGTVQLASNVSRSWILRPYIGWKIVFQFTVGAFLGTLLASRFVVTIPDNLFQIGLGVFILVMAFLPKFKGGPSFKGKWFSLGAVTGFVALFAGTVDALVGSFYLREGLTKEALVATKAACQAAVHLLKTSTYLALGFVLGPYWPLVTVMVIVVFLGNWTGKQFLNRIPEKLFVRIFRVVIVCLVVRIIGKGLGAF